MDFTVSVSVLYRAVRGSSDDCLMKIVFALIGTDRSGGVKYVFEVANRLENRGHDVKILALRGDHRWFKGLRAEVIYKQPVRFNRLAFVAHKVYDVYAHFKYGRSARPYESLLSITYSLGIAPDHIRELAELVQNFEADAAVATYYPTAFSVWLASPAKKLFYLMQDFPELIEGEGYTELRRFQLTLRLPFHFIAISNYTRELILGENPSAKVTVVNPGVDSRIFRPRRDLLDFGKGKRKVMVMLRWGAHKGNEVAVRVLNELNKKIPIHVIIVGDKKLVKTYFKIIKFNFSYSLFSGVDDETLARLYSSADAFLHTSYAEGFGSPPLEAMACGTPVVMTDSKGSRDYAVDGYNALVSQPGDVKSLAENLLRVLQDDKLRERLVENGLETARRFTWDSTAEKFEEALREG